MKHLKIKPIKTNIMITFTFDHTQDDYLEACGVKEPQLEELFETVNEVGQSCDSASEVVEKLSTTFTTQELAFVINHLQNQVKHLEAETNPLNMLKQIFEQREDQRRGGIPLGEPGEA